MANKTNFTVDEWDQLRLAPMNAALLVMAASPSGPLGLVKESSALSEALATTMASAQTELLQVLALDLQENTILHKLKQTEPEAMRAATLDACRQVSNLLYRKASETEAAEFRQWLLSIARKVAEAAKEGGFLGFGGTAVSEEEAAALDQLEIALR